jgi:hypothetical protein
VPDTGTADRIQCFSGNRIIIDADRSLTIAMNRR